MEIASFVVSVVAVFMSVVGVYYARRSDNSARRSADAAARSADHAGRSATAAEGSLAVQRSQRHDQLQPHLSSSIECSDGVFQLNLSLDAEDQPLTGLDLAARAGSGFYFQLDNSGIRVRYKRFLASDDEAALAVSIGANHGDVYLSPGEKMIFLAYVDQDHEAPIFIDATCYRNGEEWTVVLAPELKFGSDAWDYDAAT